MFTNTLLHAHFKCIKQRRRCIVDLYTNKFAKESQEKLLLLIKIAIYSSSCSTYMEIRLKLHTILRNIYTYQVNKKRSSQDSSSRPLLRQPILSGFTEDDHIRKNTHILGCIIYNTNIYITQYCTFVLCQPKEERWIHLNYKNK